MCVCVFLYLANDLFAPFLNSRQVGLFFSSKQLTSVFSVGHSIYAQKWFDFV